MSKVVAGYIELDQTPTSLAEILGITRRGAQQILDGMVEADMAQKIKPGHYEFHDYGTWARESRIESVDKFLSRGFVKSTRQGARFTRDAKRHVEHEAEREAKQASVASRSRAPDGRHFRGLPRVG